MKLRIMRSAWIALLFMSLSVTAQTTGELKEVIKKMIRDGLKVK